MDYYDRVRKEPSVHQKLVVCASIGNKLETMQSQIVTLKDEVALMKNELKDQAADLKDEVTAAREEATTARKEATAARKEATAARKEATAARKEATAVRKEATAVREEVEALKARLDVYDQERLYSYSANLLTHMLKKLQESDKGNVDKGDNNPEHSTTRYANIVSQMDRKVFEKKTNLFGSCFDLFKKYPMIVARRYSLAHGSEGAFAKLLMSPQYRNTNHYYQWAPFFPYCYGKTLEEMANSLAGCNIEDLYSIGE